MLGALRPRGPCTCPTVSGHGSDRSLHQQHPAGQATWHSAPQDDYSVLSELDAASLEVLSQLSDRHAASRQLHHLPLLPRPPGDIVLNARRTALAMIVSGQVEVAKVLVRTQASGPSTDRYDHRILSRTHERVRHPPAMNTEIEPLNGEQHKRQRRPQA